MTEDVFSENSNVSFYVNSDETDSHSLVRKATTSEAQFLRILVKSFKLDRIKAFRVT